VHRVATATAVRCWFLLWFFRSVEKEEVHPSRKHLHLQTAPSRPRDSIARLRILDEPHAPLYREEYGGFPIQPVGRRFSSSRLLCKSSRTSFFLSLDKFPTNREIYREFLKFCARTAASPISKYQILLLGSDASRKNRTGNFSGPISDLSGDYQGLLMMDAVVKSFCFRRRRSGIAPVVISFPLLLVASQRTCRRLG
jgi:hypothetical protein